MYEGKVTEMSTKYGQQGKDNKHTITVTIDLGRSKTAASRKRKEEEIKASLYGKKVQLFIL